MWRRVRHRNTDLGGTGAHGNRTARSHPRGCVDISARAHRNRAARSHPCGRADVGAPEPMANAERIDDRTLVVTYPVDVWFSGSKTFEAELPFDGGTIESITLDPHGRFPDRNPADNMWPKAAETSGR